LSTGDCEVLVKEEFLQALSRDRDVFEKNNHSDAALSPPEDLK